MQSPLIFEINLSCESVRVGLGGRVEGRVRVRGRVGYRVRIRDEKMKTRD